MRALDSPTPYPHVPHCCRTPNPVPGCFGTEDHQVRTARRRDSSLQRPGPGGRGSLSRVQGVSHKCTSMLPLETTNLHVKSAPVSGGGGNTQVFLYSAVIDNGYYQYSSHKTTPVSVCAAVPFPHKTWGVLSFSHVRLSLPGSAYLCT